MKNHSFCHAARAWKVGGTKRLDFDLACADLFKLTRDVGLRKWPPDGQNYRANDQPDNYQRSERGNDPACSRFWDPTHGTRQPSLKQLYGLGFVADPT